MPGSPIAYPHLEAALSGPDRDRAGRFRVPEDRARFVIGRRLLAALLHEHLHHPPGPLELALTERGRPHLPDAPATAFSISHAGSLVAVALATGGRVGIDVESLRGRIDLAALAKRIHNPADLARFAALPDADKPGAFFRAWTGKEAILKAKGTGLSGDMKAISVPLNSAITHVHETGASWQLQPLPVPAGYVGAIAWDDPGKAIRLRHYETSELK